MSPNGNILLVANWDSGVGYAWWLMENFWTTIAAHFSHSGISCHLVYPTISRIPDSIAASGIEVTEHDFRNRSPGSLRRLRRLIRTNNIRYIYLTDSPHYSWYYLLLRMWGIRKIVVHDHRPGERTLPSAWRMTLKCMIQKLPLLSADHFIAVSDFVYRRFIDIICIPREKCSCAPNGIVPLEPAGFDHHYAQDVFGIPYNRIIVVNTGRATYYKGIDFIIECASELINNQQLDQLHFLYCGDGPDLEDFKSLVREHNLEGSFTFAGARSDIRKILPSCHIGFHAAIGEVGYSLSILEYMSAGLATIVPDRPSTAQAITSMETGILYQPADIRSATTAIRHALDEENRKNLGTNAALRVRKEYNISTTNTRLIEILETVF